MSINFKDSARQGRRIYTDIHNNLIGFAEYDTEKCVFRFMVDPEFCDGCAEALHGVEAHSLTPLDSLALAARQMADAAGY